MLRKTILLLPLGLLCAGCHLFQVQDPLPFGSEVVGYWDQSFEQHVTPPSGANLAIAFCGYSDITKALQCSAELRPRMVGDKYLSVGGGNDNGAFSMATIEAATAALKAGEVTGYDGIAFDVEECEGEGLASYFSEAFSVAKSQDLKVLVTVSHSEPFGCEDSVTLMKAFLNDSSIDYLSPQLYTTGNETQNDYTAVGTPWSAYAGAKAAVVPSIVRASLYPDAQQFFSSQGVTLVGFIQWNNSGS